MTAHEFIQARVDDLAGQAAILRGWWRDRVGLGTIIEERTVAAVTALLDLHFTVGGPGCALYPSSTPFCNSCSSHEDIVDAPCPTMRHVASIWQDHPDYQPEWSPA